jgi:hypothetical protein
VSHTALLNRLNSYFEMQCNRRDEAMKRLSSGCFEKILSDTYGFALKYPEHGSEVSRLIKNIQMVGWKNYGRWLRTMFRSFTKSRCFLNQ